MYLLPCANADTGSVRLQSLLSNVEASSLHTSLFIEFASPAVVYEQLLANSEVTAASVRTHGWRNHGFSGEGVTTSRLVG
jgi:hypothetical protein